eukprot:Hpha_TRINITY_DN19165_c0_g1::TRINITY_DN19165_c0_g1_i1::g.94754::m.94754
MLAAAAFAVCAAGADRRAEEEQVVWTHIQGQIHPQDFRPGECTVSTRPPVSAELVWCHWYSSNTCCLPAADQEAFDQFFAMMDLGLQCSHSRHSIRNKYRKLREWFCLACDPREPDYRYSAGRGSPLNNVKPKQVPTGQLVFNWRVCKSFVDSAWHGDGSPEQVDGGLYDECGVKTQNHCDAQKQVVWDPTAQRGYGGVVDTSYPVLNGWDPYMCGDNLVVPSKFYQGATAAEDFLRAVTPPSFEDIPFEFVVVDDTITDTDCKPCVYDGKKCRASGGGSCPASCNYRNGQCRGFDYELTPCFRGSSS